MNGSNVPEPLVNSKTDTIAGGYCGSPPLIENGYILNSTGVQGGDTATYECNNDFTIEGAQVIKCNASHQWDRAPNCTCMYYPDCFIQAVYPLLYGFHTLPSVSV